jgi:hypothetical protein
MILCPRCSFQNDDKAAVCAGPDCGDRLSRKEPVCLIHRLPEGATVCHICAAQASSQQGPKRIAGATHGYIPSAMHPPFRQQVDWDNFAAPIASRRNETVDLRGPRPADPALPESTATRMATVNGRLQRPDGAESGPPSPQGGEHTLLEAAEPAQKTVPVAPAAVTVPRFQAVNLHQENAVVTERPGRSIERLAGLLVTYTWDPDGQIYPLRTGLNRIGTAPECEIWVPQDGALSFIHAVIRVRSKFLINDLDSANGTLVNDTPIDETYLRLENYARITTGRTVWTFIKIEPSPDTC